MFAHKRDKSRGTASDYQQRRLVHWQVEEEQTIQHTASITIITGSISKKLEHGEEAQFIVSFYESPNWMRDFAVNFVKDISDKSIKTLRAQIHTSVGRDVAVVPEKEMLKALQECKSAGESVTEPGSQ